MEAGENIWVLSDVHLGAENSNHKGFSEFLRWVAEKKEYTVKGSSIVLSKPTRLILLGDFLELWNPLENDFKNTALQLIDSLKDLFRVAEEIILVTGNHDEALEGYEAIYSIEKPRFRIARRHYPDEEPRYIQLGEHRYFFLHGHQFDKLFLRMGSLSRLPSLMASLNNALMPFFPPRGWGLPILFLAITILHLMVNWPPQWTVYTTTILSVPRIFTYLQGPLWKVFGRHLTDRPKHRDIEELVSKRYYDKRKDTIAADRVLFGHTHKPEISSPTLTKNLGKTLINTGSWVTDEGSTKKNTVVAITGGGALLLEWKGGEEGFSLLNQVTD